MHYRRGWVCVFLLALTTINYADRVALSVAAPVAEAARTRRDSTDDHENAEE